LGEKSEKKRLKGKMKNCARLLKNRKKKHVCTTILAESIILQCLEDLWDDEFRHESISFFTNDCFSVCATIAHIDIGDQIRLLHIVNSIVKGNNGMRLSESDPFSSNGKGICHV
jgi:hypothetical protein